MTATPAIYAESLQWIVQRVMDGASVVLEPAITSGALGGTLLAITVTVLGPDSAPMEIWHGHIADIPQSQWPEDSYAIACAKTALTVRTGLTAEEVHKRRRELLQPGDVEWWGNTVIDSDGMRIVVSASGLDESWDQRICETLADLLVISLAAADPGMPPAAR